MFADVALKFAVGRITSSTYTVCYIPQKHEFDVGNCADEVSQQHGSPVLQEQRNLIRITLRCDLTIAV